MNGQETTSSGLASLVPQLFFDIIARLVPGSFLIIAFVLAGIGPEDTWLHLKNWLNKRADDYPSVIISVGAIFVVSYTLSVVMMGIRETPSLFRKEKPQREFSLKYDYIKWKDKDAGGRIAKLNAEIHMASNLALGFFLCLVVNVWRMVDPLSGSRKILTVSLLIAILGSVSARYHFQGRLKLAVENHADILGYKEWEETVKVSPDAVLNKVEAATPSKGIDSTDESTVNQIASVSDAESVK